jgi:hypothetical protein
MDEEKVRTEEYRVTGEGLVAKIQELLHEGNVRRIIIKDEQGKTRFEFPLTLGVVGTLVAPQLAVIAAVVVVAKRYTVVVEKDAR